MLYLTCTTITSVDLAHYGVSRAKDWVSVYCGTSSHITLHLQAQFTWMHLHVRRQYVLYVHVYESLLLN